LGSARCWPVIPNACEVTRNVLPEQARSEETVASVRAKYTQQKAVLEQQVVALQVAAL